MYSSNPSLIKLSLVFCSTVITTIGVLKSSCSFNTNVYLPLSPLGYVF